MEAQDTAVNSTTADSASVTPDSRRRGRLEVTTGHGTPPGRDCPDRPGAAGQAGLKTPHRSLHSGEDEHDDPGDDEREDGSDAARAALPGSAGPAPAADADRRRGHAGGDARDARD